MRAICGVQLNDRKDIDFMFMLGFDKTIDQLAIQYNKLY